MQDYAPIAEHGLIGDLQTAALVTTDGSIDWYCCPRFDSPSVFASLLDSSRGGHFQVRPTEGDYVSRQLYLPDTAVLVTRFMTEDGVGELLDFMPPAGSRVSDNHRIVRLMRCVRGRVAYSVDIEPRFDYGRQSHETHVTEHGAVFTTPELTLTLHSVRDPTDERLGHVSTTDSGGVHVTFELLQGQQRGVVLESAAGGPPREIPNVEVDGLLEHTSSFWRRWLTSSTYDGRWRETLQRSAIVLKLMTYAPTGALVAAPTAGLPEQVGGERNWDYRYTWVRDGSFSVHALLAMGFTEEAAAFGRWLRDRIEEHTGGEGGPLKIMYRVDGSSDLSEESLNHWEGYRGSRPVRIGNGASDQRQMDIYGEALESIYLADSHGLALGHRGWLALQSLIDWLSDNWDQPCEGIWETRGGQKDFTYGRVMSWAALDRSIRLATSYGRPADVATWTRARDDIYRQGWDRGFNTERQAFVQHYDDKVLDASLLRMAAVGFIRPDDPQWLSTLRAMDDELVTDSLVYRYDPAASPDGLAGDEGTFSLCTFAFVEALARAGRLDEAVFMFEKMLTYANHVGLYAEEIGLTGEQLGNFPQAFTHLALIDAAITLDSALDARAAQRGGGAPRQSRDGS
jgi:GH15 family glucan-1,4-alpha-glucosidase